MKGASAVKIWTGDSVLLGFRFATARLFEDSAFS